MKTKSQPMRTCWQAGGEPKRARVTCKCYSKPRRGTTGIDRTGKAPGRGKRVSVHPWTVLRCV